MPYIEDDFNMGNLNNNPKRKGKNTMKHIKALVLVLCVMFLVCIILLAFQLIEKYKALNKAEQINEIAREIIKSESILLTEEPIVQATEEPVEKVAAETIIIEETFGDTVVEEPKHLLEQIVNLRETFDNEDIVGWLTIEDTAIDYVVAQAPDNDYYLARDVYGEKSSAGTLFMDYENNAYEFDRNVIIYGHNMRNGTMFHNLRYYRNRPYYEEHRYISLITPYEETVWEVFAFYETHTNFNYIQVIFPDDDAFMSLVSAIKEKSLYDTGVDVTKDDKILTLSTCADSSRDTRYALHAKLLP